MDQRQLIKALYDIGSLKFGQYTLKSGHTSPFYVDLRNVISYPPLLKAIVARINDKAACFTYDLVCGVPYTALPFATAHSLATDTPMLIRRKEAKDYGTKKMIEGVFSSAQRCLIIEDLITTGTSILETIAPLEALGIKVTDAIVVIDREQGGVGALRDRGYNTHPLFSLSTILSTLAEMEELTEEECNLVQEHCHEHQLV